MGVQITLTDGTSRNLIEYNEFSDVVLDQLLDLNIKQMVKEEVEVQIENGSGVAKPDITVYLFEGDNLNSLKPAEGKEFTHGDFAIGQTVIKATEPKKYSRTAYIYNVDHWEALNGNYSANNIYFDNDIEITKEIGYITLDETGAGKIPAKDKNLVEVFGEMFAQDKDPTVSQPKINSFTLSNAGKSFEVGTKLTNLTFAASFYAGNYQYGPEDTGIIPSWEIKQGNNIISQEASGTINELVINDNTNYVLKAIASYEQGAIPLTFKQKEKAELRIAAGSVEATTKAITGYRKCFYKVNNKDNVISIDTLKSLTSDTIISTFTCDSKTPSALPTKLNLNEGTQQLVFLAPTGMYSKLSVTDTTNPQATFTLGNTKYSQALEVAGANGYSPIKYDMWVISLDTPYPTNAIITIEGSK